MQQPDGRFIEKELLKETDAKGKICDDLGLLLFDVDGDGDLICISLPADMKTRITARLILTGCI